MPFYVKLGPKGFYFRVGRMMVSFFGAIVYWRHARKRRVRHVPRPHFARTAVTTRGID